MNKTPILIAASLLAIATGTVLAQAPAAGTDAPKPPRHFALDANKDGVIDRAEAARHPFLAERFDSLDKNKDGKLDASEAPRPRHGHDGRRRGHGHGHPGFGGPRRGFHAPFAAADKDGDDRISKAEALAAATARFERMDVNKDGYIDAADREAMAKQRREAWFKAVDANGDGQLSQAELDAARARHHAGKGPAPKQAQ